MRDKSLTLFARLWLSLVIGGVLGLFMIAVVADESIRMAAIIIALLGAVIAITVFSIMRTAEKGMWDNGD
jgi:uncharacterized membrane protein YeaQ/YmgE (transglycosylase-associated protein family)